MTERYEPGTRPRLRDSIVVAIGEDGRMQVRNPYERTVSTFDVEAWVPQVVSKMDGSKTAEELGWAVAPAVPRGDVEAIIDALAEERLLAVSAPSRDVTGRHSRQLRLFDDMLASGDLIDASTSDGAQSILRNSRVAVVGVGGAGSWVVQALASVGVGNLDVIDADVVEVSNLNRQVLFRLEDVGSIKVEAARRRVEQIDPSIRVTSRNRTIRTVAALREIIAGCDLVINCADHPTVTLASDIVAEACMAMGIPHIVGGAYGAVLGAPGVSVIPGETVCWFCVRATTADDDGGTQAQVIKSAGPAGSIAPIAGVVGSLTAWEAVRLLLGVSPTLSGSIRELDLSTLEWHVRAVQARESCRCVHAVL